jgi:HemY protein
LTRDGWSRLIREYSEYGRLIPPPLEGPPRGLPEQEFRLLAAPTAEGAPPDEAVIASHAPDEKTQLQQTDISAPDENADVTPAGEPSQEDGRIANEAAAARGVS